MSGDLIGTEFVEEIISTCIQTAFLPKGIPVSALLITKSGMGKSSLLLSFENEDNKGPAKRIDRITSSGLYDVLVQDSKNEVKFFLISDLNPSLSGKASTVQLTMANMMTLLSEGSVYVADGRQQKTIKHAPIGLIAGVTEEMLRKHCGHWRTIGFMRRFLPIHYSHSEITKQQILDAMHTGKVTLWSRAKVKFPQARNGTPVLSKKTHDLIKELLAPKLAMHLGQYPYIQRTVDGPKQAVKAGEPIAEYTPNGVLIQMATAHAMFQNRMKTTDEDDNFLRGVVDITNWMNVKQL